MNNSADSNIVHVKQKAIRSVKWAALGEVSSRSIQPLIVIILARLLVPSDFGIIGIAMVAIGLAQILQDFGLAKTLIQRETKIDKSANIIFWTNLTLSFFLYLILFITAPLLAIFFREPKVINIVRVLCLQIVFLSLIIVHQALFQRNFQFKQLFFIRLFSAIIPGFVSIPMALSGYGVWSLVFGTLAGNIVQVFLFWKASPWRPKLTYNFHFAKQLLGFSSWVTLEAFFGWLIMWGDSIVLGHFLGIKDLGVYRVGVTFITLIFGIFFSPLMPIAFSAFSRLQSNYEELKQAFLKTTKIIASISLPLGIGLAVIAPHVSSVILGEKWQGIEIVITFIGIKDAITWLVGFNPEVYRAMGRPDINTKLIMVAMTYYLPVYVFTAPHGLLVFCIARLSVAVVSIGLHIFVINRVLNLPFTYLLQCIRAPLTGSLIFAIAAYLTISFTNIFYGVEGWLKMVALIAFGAIVYIISMWLLQKEIVLQFWRIAKESAK